MPYSPSASLNAISNSILKSKNITEQIKIFIQPFDYINNSMSILMNYIYCIFIVIILSIGLYKYGMIIVREKSKGLKKKLQLIKVNSKCYWISTFIVDSSLYLITCLLIIILSLIFHCDALYHIWSLVFTIIIIILR